MGTSRCASHCFPRKRVSITTSRTSTPRTRSWIACAICFAAGALMRLSIFGVLLALAGCCSRSEGAQSIVDHHTWTVLSDSEDPFIARKPMGAPCTPESFGYEDFAEEPSFTVKSMGCAYITVQQK